MERVTNGFDSLPEKVSEIYDKVGRIEKYLSENSNKQEESNNELLTIDQASDYTSLAKQTIYGMVSERKIPFIKRAGSKRLYFSKSELQDWLMAGRKRTMKPESVNNQILKS